LPFRSPDFLRVSVVGMGLAFKLPDYQITQFSNPGGVPYPPGFTHFDPRSPNVTQPGSPTSPELDCWGGSPALAYWGGSPGCPTSPVLACWGVRVTQWVSLVSPNVTQMLPNPRDCLSSRTQSRDLLLANCQLLNCQRPHRSRPSGLASLCLNCCNATTNL
jgi:hypothetical protein